MPAPASRLLRLENAREISIETIADIAKTRPNNRQYQKISSDAGRAILNNK